MLGKFTSDQHLYCTADLRYSSFTLYHLLRSRNYYKISVMLTRRANSGEQKCKCLLRGHDNRDYRGKKYFAELQSHITLTLTARDARVHRFPSEVQSISSGTRENQINLHTEQRRDAPTQWRSCEARNTEESDTQ